MSPTKVLWISAAAIAIGIATNNVHIISVAIVVTVMAATGAVVFWVIGRSNGR